MCVTRIVGTCISGPLTLGSRTLGFAVLLRLVKTLH